MAYSQHLNYDGIFIPGLKDTYFKYLKDINASNNVSISLILFNKQFLNKSHAFFFVYTFTGFANV